MDPMDVTADSTRTVRVLIVDDQLPFRAVARTAPRSSSPGGAGYSSIFGFRRSYSSGCSCFSISTEIRPFSHVQFIGKIEGLRCTL